MSSKILIVDDDVLISWLLADMLQDLGFAYCEASSARQAMELVRDDADIDMMLTDLHMPGTNGYQLTDQVRMMRPDLPIVLVTGDACAANGKHNLPVLSKPYTSRQLDSAIKEAQASLPN